MTIASVFHRRSMSPSLASRTGLVLVAGLLPFLLFGCDESKMTPVRKTPNLNESIGWIHGTCLAIQNSNLKPGTSIQVVLLGKTQALLDSKVVASSVEPSSDCPPLLSDRAGINKQDGRFFYQLDLKQDAHHPMAIGVAAAASVAVRKRDLTVEFDLNNDGQVEHAGTCLTSEGVQFFVSASAVFDQTALWSDYYYLGYDNKPTCP